MKEGPIGQHTYSAVIVSCAMVLVDGGQRLFVFPVYRFVQVVQELDMRLMAKPDSPTRLYASVTEHGLTSHFEGTTTRLMTKPPSRVTVDGLACQGKTTRQPRLIQRCQKPTGLWSGILAEDDPVQGLKGLAGLDTGPIDSGIYSLVHALAIE